MTAIIRPALSLLAGFTLLLGVAVPLAFTGVAQLLMPGAANGSLVLREGRPVGSALVGQAFTGQEWFQPRPSATLADGEAAAYNAMAGAASNLGPSSAALLQAIEGRVAGLGGGPVPADAATASASGLDPHVSPENAARQVARIAAARGLPAPRVAALVAEMTEGRELGIFGAPRVNVLALNLRLAALR
ncbi:potassium-transporting ATPase subunit KdpC [Roseomonas sp. 18066]|uniref:potassium-transporting ATPase subunit KdpC n=1 Tax=Roseomonas sp. 18066 TaxID=2681412 RepID=UPI001356D19D|nr:potassium-transporting ATPase subunit KdpC [Roseomonas sp. 18066]